jgi:trehalose-phosphatase
VTAPALPVSETLLRRLSGVPLLLLLDIDGTLSPIAPRPEYASVPEETRDVLAALAALRDVHVAVVSGRQGADARRLIGLDSVWVIGNHGFEVGAPNAAPAPRPDVVPFEHAIATAVSRSHAIASEMPGVLVEDKRWTMSIHYRLAHPRIVPELVAATERIASDLRLRLTRGKEVLELRPPVDVDKGTAAVDLAETLGALSGGASVLCAGDDRTDEDAFRALRLANPSTVTVRVGGDDPGVQTDAEFGVSDPAAMRALLDSILEQRRGRTGD